MNRIHNNEVKNIDESNLLHNVLNPYKFTDIKNIIPLFYMYAWIHIRVKWYLRVFESYWIVDVVIPL